MTNVLGIIGGSGLYDIEGIENPQWIAVDSTFGETSDELLVGFVDGLKVVFLPRHGRGHKISPSNINYRANIDAMKRAGVTDIVSISACGSFREEMAPRDFVIVDQFIDRTFARKKTFFDDDVVAHVSVALPTCGNLSDVVEMAGKDIDVKIHRGGTYLAMEGPQFSSLAESHMYRSWGCDVIGMTNMPEAKLAREAEICYVTVAMVTDYDSWHPDHGEVDVTEIIKTLGQNSANAKTLVGNIAKGLKAAENRHPCVQGCDHALEFAIMTQDINPETKAKLSAVAGRVLNK
ncbi:S-methyl-5'-thioadenosine phosphorylase [Pseudemcibacter aquimaris]|uniref:S-methyl-5'-thioadenosine phosphorylase n=1 Tax=Pseudemcibacter aquimaris TaxID=2857064 RepID=UPI002011343B|nr:S-methyl-5'-thioadenosine phosphorylase [Pseudemcibacter aquimaris]MCC3860993.1 S-methyl-5'-thioadenosine phosphorylase [Pseudemcibacter aquimaris]WDU59811.1 S-methyl-5'-thioadenosine phosphorylase [Pseudemcibacter aquimaris]